MPSTVQWSIDVAVGGGPSLAATSSFLADAYAVVEVVAPATGSATEPFQAGTIAELSLVMIAASHYDPEDLTFTLGGETVALDGPQLYVGAGMLGRFGADVAEITVDNDLEVDVTVTVLVGRRA